MIHLPIWYSQYSKLVFIVAEGGRPKLLTQLDCMQSWSMQCAGEDEIHGFRDMELFSALQCFERVLVA